MLGTEVVWHPGIQNVIFVCVYTTNNGFICWVHTDLQWVLCPSCQVVNRYMTSHIYALLLYSWQDSVTTEPKLAQIGRWKKNIERVQIVRHGGFDQPYPSTTKRACLENSCFVPLRPTPYHNYDKSIKHD